MTHFRIAEAEGSNSRASASGDRPERTSPTISRRNSGGYRLCFLAIVDPSLLPYFGCVHESGSTPAELEPIVRRLREAWPQVRITVRGDSAFSNDELMVWCEKEGIDYVLGLAQNDRLKRRIATRMETVRQLQRVIGKAVRQFQELRYQTRDTWSCERRVVAKVEHLPRGKNPRFIVTSVPVQECEGRRLYEEVYCARGDMENRIKEQQMGLFADRTSTRKLAGNQLRLYFSAFAYVMMETLRRVGLAGTKLARAQSWTLRVRLLKIGAQVRITTRKVWLSFSESYPHAALLRTVLAQVQALPLRC